MREYATVYLEKVTKHDEDIKAVLDAWASDGFVLHSIVPKVEDGNTVAYTIIFDATDAER